jgi:hypothetical protein
MAEERASPSQRPGCQTRFGDERNTVVGPEGQHYILNKTAVAVWQLCDGTIGSDEMITAICELFDAHREVIESDVGRVLDEFELNQLIQWVPDPGKGGDASWPRSSSPPVETRERT